MKRSLLRTGALLLIPAAGVMSCGTPRNCLVIPAQVELLEERRTAALTDLENTASQVERQYSSIERMRAQLETLRAEKAFLDSLLPAREEGRKP